MKVLIIDDEPNIVMALEYALRKKGYEVYIGRDGFEALSLSETHTPDVILLDIMMPHLDGYETIEILKKNEDLNNTQIIFMSAKTAQEDIDKGLALGAADYITKPFTIKKIIESIEKSTLKN